VSQPQKNASRSTPLVERYASGGAILRYAVTDLTPGHAAAHPGPGAWSVAELAAHLVDCDLVFSDRMKRVIAEDDPVLQGFDESLWMTRLGSGQMPVGDAVDLLATNRVWMTPILRRCADTDFARTGRHTEAGTVTLADLLAKATNHLDHHLRFLYAKRATLGVALPPRYASEQLGI